MDKVKRFKEIVNEAADLYAKKNADYGDSFGDTWRRLGPVSGLTRMYDKLNRASSLIKGSENHFESLEDTLKDLLCYSTMALMELEIDRSKEQ